MTSMLLDDLPPRKNPKKPRTHLFEIALRTRYLTSLLALCFTSLSTALHCNTGHYTKGHTKGQRALRSSWRHDHFNHFLSRLSMGYAFAKRSVQADAWLFFTTSRYKKDNSKKLRENPGGFSLKCLLSFYTFRA